MDQPLPHRHRTRRILTVLATLFSCFLLYALSIGPAILLNKRGVITVGTLETIYFPLNFVANMVPGSTELLDHYVSFWVPQ